jgi:hypothetical protein
VFDIEAKFCLLWIDNMSDLQREVAENEDLL